MHWIPNHLPSLPFSSHVLSALTIFLLLWQWQGWSVKESPRVMWSLSVPHVKVHLLCVETSCLVIQHLRLALGWDRHYDPWCLSSLLWKIQTWGYWIIRSLSHVGQVLATWNHSFEFFLFLSQHLLICLWMCMPRCFWRSEDNFGCSFYCVSSGDWTQGTRLAGRYLAEV